MSDIEARSVFILDIDKSPVGTVTLKGAEICRLLVFPEPQPQSVEPSVYSVHL